MAIVTVGLNAPTQDDIDSFKVAFQITGTGGGTGEDGKSAYEIAVDNGFVGTEAQWLNSLHGADGAPGPAGPQGIQGGPGPAGPAGANGINGTIGAPGPQGVAGPSAYQIAVSNGFVGNEQDWLNSLWGPQGIQGPVGPQGGAGPQGIQGLPGAQGPKGDKGDKGDTGAQGIPGNTGPQGATGLQGLPGLAGSQGPMGPQGPAGMNGEDGTDATVTYQAVIDALGYTPGTGSGTGNANTADITSAINAHIAAADPHGVTYPITPGGYAVYIVGSDLNILYRTGFYRGHSFVHAPLDNGGWWHLQIASHDTYWIKQTATAFGSGNNAGDIYERLCYGGAWTSWAKVYKEGTTDLVSLEAGRSLFISDQDLNAVRPTGFYRGGNLTNAPDAGWRHVLHEAWPDNGYAKQTITEFLGSHRTHVRVQESGVWGAWKQALFEGDAIGATAPNSGAFTSLSTTQGATFGGNVGIGVTPPASGANGLYIAGSIRSSYLSVVGYGGGYQAANKFGVDHYNNTARIYSSGGDASTNAGYAFYSTRSDGNNQLSLLEIDSEGNHSFRGAGAFGGALTAAGLSLGGNTLALAESSVRNWQLQATGGNVRLSSGDGNGAFVGAGDGTMDLGAYDKRWRDIHASRYVVAGTPYPSASPAYHVLSGTFLSAGDIILSVYNSIVGSVQFRYGGSSGSPAFISSSAVLNVGLNINSGRSIDATGTINANGADYAEHEYNNGYKVIKGQIIGFDSEGMLTPYFSEAIRFAVKSTEPGYTGGNTWMANLPPRPNKPVLHDVQRRSYGEADEVNPDAEVDALIEQEYQDALLAAEVDYQASSLQYERDLSLFNAAVKDAADKVDRIAYCGKVPVNYTGATPGDYLIVKKGDNDSITCYSTRVPTHEQYLLCIGRVNKILPDGRAEVAVIIH